MFIKELQLYIDYLKELADSTDFSNKREVKKFSRFTQNLEEGIDYYKNLFFREVIKENQFLTDLLICESRILEITQQAEVV